MKWPWVSRARLEQAEDLLRLAHAENRRERDIAEQRYDALLEKFTALRVQGAVPETPVVVEYPTRAPGPPDELRDLIHERCGGDLRKRGMMLRQLKQDRLDRVSEADIRRRIEEGVSSDGVPV